ncbi:GFA family protein [Devosia sp.]|uniref:GFA family protein n=1 Tax=Devosia sp. TaxID=1871048 RepID=UPI0032661F7C
MTYVATCHCGSTRIEVDRLPESATACTCTYCSKSGGLWGYYRPDEVRVVAAAEDRVYTASGFNLHHFCAKCGTNTYGDSPDWSTADIGGDGSSMPTARKIGLNVRLFDNIDIASFRIDTIDGRNLW